MLIWTTEAAEVLRDASAKATNLTHREVHPLHMLWVLAGREGMDALRHGRSDQEAAKLRFQVERDLGKLPCRNRAEQLAPGECATPGFKLQRLLLRAAEISARKALDSEKGRIGVTELMKALLQDDPRTAVLIRSRESAMQATA